MFSVDLSWTCPSYITKLSLLTCPPFSVLNYTQTHLIAIVSNCPSLTVVKVTPVTDAMRLLRCPSGQSYPPFRSQWSPPWLEWPAARDAVHLSKVSADHGQVPMTAGLAKYPIDNGKDLLQWRQDRSMEGSLYFTIHVYVTTIRMDNQLQRAKSIFTDRWLVLERTPRPRPLWFYSDTAHTPIRPHRRLSSGLQGRSSSSSSVDVRMRWSASPRGSLWFRAPLESPFYVGASFFFISHIRYCLLYDLLHLYLYTKTPYNLH